MTDDHGYGREWTDVLVYRRQGYTTSVADYHEHAYYEVNLIYSGNIHILLPGGNVETNRSHIVLMPPHTPHYIACKPDTLYSRQYLSFSKTLLEAFPDQWQQLRRIFGEKGRILAVSDHQREQCGQLMERIGQEQEPFRRSLLILYLLSCMGDFSRESSTPARPTPSYITEALSYINGHYGQKIVAAELARRLHVGRTTLMTAFREYTGSSLNAYLVRYRTKQAQRLLREGKTVQETAELCGFGDSSSLIRSFRQLCNTTPGRFAKGENGQGEKTL